ncbi:hypothetical protein [Nodularia sp. UHCC 0506]|uniref:hypothetical protein n=1 Tax=Nodularia sp. UHCC 0506 TaxID=3110243 RepID=UPI002B215492|nr:hypothetical protein [Nodularia sp. UHCC 0506]MEA5514842.1 hypothetical protein [Nodularia sp. UHCC 0506]
MEPLTTAAIAIGSVVATKALEKTGEKVGEVLWDKTGQFLVKLRKHFPQTVIAIEKAPEQPLDYGKALIEVESAAQADPEVAQAAQELAAAAKAEPNPKFAEILAMPNLQKLADKIGQVVMPGGTGNIQNQSF